jgi:hypothetical protein
MALVSVIADLTPLEHAWLRPLMHPGIAFPMSDPGVDRCPFDFLAHCVKTGLLRWQPVIDADTETGIGVTPAGFAAWKRWTRRQKEEQSILARGDTNV